MTAAFPCRHPARRRRGACGLLLAALVAAPAAALDPDCLHFDSFDGGLAPADDMRRVQWLHNCARRTAQPRPVPRLRDLRWDGTVAGSAQSWAGQCILEHPGDHPYGENLAAGAGPSMSAEELVRRWIEERGSYDYGSNTCAPDAVCGHYTQVVWRNTQALGCAVQSCTTGWVSGPWTLLVCRYSPPGNWVGQRPY